MFANSMRKSIRPHLHDGEELLAAVMAQTTGSNRAMMMSVLRETANPGVHRRMVVAVTSQRLLVFRQGGFFVAKAVEQLGEAPIGAVEAIDVESGKLSKWVTLRVGGRAVAVETARAQPAEYLASALEELRPQAQAA